MRAWLIAIAVGGCATASAPPPATPAFQLVPAAAGLDVAGSGGREIGFGRDQLGVLRTVARIEGRAPEEVPCAAPGRVAYGTKAVMLVFERGAFVGWATDAARAGATC
ncbi:MAG: hypothetical protein AAFY65_02090 [Pseudomonadota bacterium]